MLRSATAALVTAAFGIGGIQSGLAADLPVKARQPAPVAAAPYNWTGWYLGVNVGYGVGRHPTTWSAVSGAGYPILGAGVPLYGGPQHVMLSPEGWLGGGQIGFNVHMTPTWVVGIGAVRNVVGIRCGAISGNMKVSFQAARSIG
jgi:hypothetical protein